MKAVALENYPEINGFVEKLVIFFSYQFTLQRDNLLFTTNSPGGPDTYLTDLRGVNG